MRSRSPSQSKLALWRWLTMVGAFLWLPLHAHAEGRIGSGPLTVAIEYAAEPNCPSEDDFKAIVVGRLGYDAFRADAPDRVGVKIESRSPAFEGRIEWRDVKGNWVGDRVFPSRSNDCQELARAIAFALALQIQLSGGAGAPPPSGAAGAPEPDHPAEARPVPPTSPAPAAPIVTEPPGMASTPQAPEPSKPGARPTLAVGGGALVAFGVSSSPVPFGRVFGHLAWPHWSLELAAEVGLPATIRRADPDRAGFVQQPFLAGLAGCGALGPWSACLLAKAGAIRIAGKIDAPISPWGPLVETGLRLTLTQPLGPRVFVAIRAEGLLIVTRWRVTLDDAPVWTSSRFTEIIGLDVGVRFP